MKRLNSLAYRRKLAKVSVSTALQNPVKVSFSLALSECEPNSSTSANCAAADEPVHKKLVRSCRVKPVSLSSLAISSPAKKEVKNQTSQKEVKNQKPLPVEGPSSVSNVQQNTSGRQRRVSFSNVEVFKFAFAQGHDTVPTKGGVSLGMENAHHARHLFQLGEYSKYCKAEKRTKMCRWRAAARQVTEQQTRKSVKRKPKFVTVRRSSKRQKYADKAIEMSTSSSETEEDVIDEEGLLEQCQVYEPMRRALLDNCGVSIEESVANESLQVVGTRMQCGCRCVGQKCIPELCECALSGIQCQVDYLDESNSSNSFPCSCSASSCANPEGRTELDPLRIRNHFLQTLMRLKAAKKIVQSEGRGLDESGEVSSPQHILFKEKEEDNNSEEDTEKEKPKRMVLHSPQRQRGTGNRKGRGGGKAPEGKKQPKKRTNAKKKGEN